MGSSMHEVFKTYSQPVKQDESIAVIDQMSKKFAGPVSPHTLIQEQYSNDPWKVMICCIMLNCTTRTQFDKIVTEFFERWPDASSLHDGDPNEIAECIKSLGFKNRRTKSLRKFSHDYLEWVSISSYAGDKGIEPEDVRTLYGVGEYAARAYEIFCLGKLGDTAPEDHSLVKYWQWGVDNTEEYNKGWK